MKKVLIAFLIVALTLATVFAYSCNKNYTITYDLNGGTISEIIETYNSETEEFTVAIPTKSGCVFSGWISEELNILEPTKTVKISGALKRNIKLIAVWDRKSVKFIYNKSGNFNNVLIEGELQAGVNTEFFTYSATSVIKLSTLTPLNGDYTFDKWTYYDNDELITIPSSTFSLTSEQFNRLNEITLIPTFCHKDFTVNYVYQCTVDNQTVTCTYKGSETLPTKIEYGKTFGVALGDKAFKTTDSDYVYEYLAYKKSNGELVKITADTVFNEQTFETSNVTLFTHCISAWSEIFY